MKKDEELPPGIDRYIEDKDDFCPISIENLDDIYNSVVAKSHLNETIIKVIFRLYIQEIRTQLLRGKKVVIRGFGVFEIKGPKNNTSKKKVFIHFKPAKSFHRRINE